MAESTNTAGGVLPQGQGGGADGVSKLFKKIKAKINALISARRNSDTQLNQKNENSSEKKNRFLEFIAELILVLGLVQDFIKKTNESLSKGKKYEPKLKRTLIECFNANIACNLDDVFKLTEVDPNPYFTIEVSKLDFFGLLKINPNSRAGKIFYGGTSTTLNASIKNAIDTGNRQNWENIFWVDYDYTANEILFYVNNVYLGKPVNALITDLVNKIDLIPNFSMLLNIFDNLYGSFSFSLTPNKIDPKSLFNRTILNKYIEKVLDGGEDMEINDSFFSFTNEELFDIERINLNLSNNFLEITSCNNADSVIKPNELYPIIEQIVSASTYNEQVQVIEAGTTTLQILASKNVRKLDLPKFQIEFYTNIFKQITNVLVGYVYSPQFLVIMMIYFKMANTNPGSNKPIDYVDFIDFLKKTRNILTCIVWSYFKLILLLIIIPLILKKLVTEANKERYERNKEKYELYVAQYLALKGLLDIIKSNELLREISSSV